MDSAVLPPGLRSCRKRAGQFLLLQAPLTPSVYDIFTRAPAASDIRWVSSRSRNASDCLFVSSVFGRADGFCDEFLRHGDLSTRCRLAWGSGLNARSPCSSIRMSRIRLFLGGLVSTRARLRFTGWCQYGSCTLDLHSNSAVLKGGHRLPDLARLSIEPHQEFVGQGDTHNLGWFTGRAQSLAEGDEVGLVATHHAGHDEQDTVIRPEGPREPLARGGVERSTSPTTAVSLKMLLM